MKQLTATIVAILAFLCPCLGAGQTYYYIVSPNGYAITNHMSNDDMTYHRLAVLDRKDAYLKYVIDRDGDAAQIYCPVHRKAFDTDGAAKGGTRQRRLGERDDTRAVEASRPRHDGTISHVSGTEGGPRVHATSVDRTII